MTVLVPMRPEYFGTFSERTIAGYAHENIASFRWDEATATTRAREKFRELLPQGLGTPGHYLCEILDRAEGETIGALWFGITPSPGAHFAHLYDLYFDEGCRQEPAKATLRLLEAHCRALGVESIGMQIFAHDNIAQAMYGSLGFSITSFNLVKRLNEA